MGDRRRIWWVSAVALGVFALGALLARYLAHAVFLHDWENLVVPTVAWDVGHGHWADAPHYQYNPYQGSVWINGPLSGLGFLVFGPTLPAWKWWAFAYAAVILAAGAWVLRSTAGRQATLLWTVLFAGLPFLVKDGIVMPTGEHANAIAYPLVSLGIVLARPSPGFRRCLLAGAVFGLGCFYHRACTAAAPALGLAVLAGGWRGVLGFGLGSLTGLFCTLLNAWALVAVGAKSSSGDFVETWRHLTLELRAQPSTDSRLAKASEGMGWRLRGLLFAQPGEVLTGRLPASRAFVVAQHAWVATLLGAAPLALGAALIARPDETRRRPRAMGTAIVAALAGFYILAYVLSPFGLEQQLVDSALQEAPAMPAPAGPRYLVPGFTLLALLAAHGLGLLTSRARWLAWLMALAVGGSGLTAAWVDFTRDAEPSGGRQYLSVLNYDRFLGPVRGPPRELHRDCETQEPVARANHLRSWGWFDGEANLTRPPNRAGVLNVLKGMRSERPMTDEEALFALEGIGIAFGALPYHPDDLLAVAFEVARGLKPAQGDALLRGVARELGPEGRVEDPLGLCVEVHGVRPLCARLAGNYWSPTPQLPTDPDELLGEQAPAALREAPLRQEIFRGLGAADARFRILADVEDTLSEWPEADAAAYRRGFDDLLAARRWVDGAPWTPAHVP